MTSPEHTPVDDPCRKCGLPAFRHRRRKRSRPGRKDYHTPEQRKAQGERRKREHEWYAGIDGEGQGREVHNYTMLAWSDTFGRKREYIYAEKGLTTKECLDFILDMPEMSKIFAFSFNYDLTKILTDVDDKSLYALFRPEERKQAHARFPSVVQWEGYNLNLISSKFSVSKGNRRRVIWDIFKFYQCRFTKACENWKVGTDVQIKRMEKMKTQRADFDRLEFHEILEYCYEECAFMAELAQRLTDAHRAAGLKLKNYFGAGSSGSAMLETMSIEKQERRGPDDTRHAVASAFFGGRFENSVLGEVHGRVWGYDISSAYPYQTTFLPCLKCGKWYHTLLRGDIDRATHAVVHYSIDQSEAPWAPFPFRLNDGSITFPRISGGGWVWRDEYIAGERLFPGVKFREAYVYNTKCKHCPFAKIPQYYLERLKLGKEGAGIVLKLATNSVYGKLAQSVGEPKYQSWIWAGMITSGTRAQILDLLGLHKDRSNLLMVATDGIYTRERLDTPKPKDTGTSHVAKPLGGWEEKEIKSGVFMARPGIYCPLEPTDELLSDIRARGIGRSTMSKHWRMLVDGLREGKELVELPDLSRFHGTKSSISRRISEDEDEPFTYHRSPLYGQWTSRPVQVTFNPLPKRDGIRKDGTLKVRTFPLDLESEPYTRSMVSSEASGLKLLMEELLEQPDGGDLTDYEMEE